MAMNSFKQLLCFLILFSGLHSSWAQYQFNTYSGWEEDIPLKLVRDLEIADDGTIWAVSNDRIVSFDGVN